MKTNYIFLGGFFPESIYEDIIKNSKGNIQFAADAFQQAIIKGFMENEESITCINLPYIGSYPKRYKKLWSPNYLYQDGSGVAINTISFCNFTGIKFFSIYIEAYRALKKAVVNDNKNIILVYAVYLPFLKAAIDVKRKFENVKIVLIVPDLPQYMSETPNVIIRKIKELYNKVVKRETKHVDGYVLLSKYMAEDKILNVGDKPWVIVEGIYGGDDETVDYSKKDKTILYAGTLAKRYGILNLLNAFRQINNPDYSLIICGAGDSENIIRRVQTEDKRINFIGQLSHNDVKKLQRRASLLVNPRTSTGIFTKFSFPSKTMEYLASGTPAIMYRLPGIPEEYYQFFYSPKDETVSSLKECIESILKMDIKSIQDETKKARQFILEKKSPRNQVAKIISLIEKL